MTDDDRLYQKLKHQWGVGEAPLLVGLPAKTLLQFACTAYKSVGLLTAIGILGSDQKVLAEADRTERMLNCYINDLIR